MITISLFLVLILLNLRKIDGKYYHEEENE